MPVIFSHPSYPTSDGYSVVGYNLIASRAKGNTYSVSGVSTGSQIVTPVSMTNIAVGTVLNIDLGLSTYEQVTVTAVTSTTFTATFAQTHSANFTIQSTVISPNYYGPWIIVSSNYTNNLSILDMNGSLYDLYRVQPIVQLNNAGSKIPLNYSRAFYSTTPLFDSQISALIDNFRTSFISDVPIPQTDSTNPTESTGQGIMPFITDASTSRFYLSFIPNADPVKFRDTDVLVYAGSSAATALPLVLYQDYFPNPTGGYIDFATNPAANSYLRVEYKSFDYTDDECRSALTNAISELALYGITDGTFAVNSSNNYFYLQVPLPDRDIAQIVCTIAQKNLLGSKIHQSFKSSEAWKAGKTGFEFTADPSRSIQAGTLWQSTLRDQIQQMANHYIINNRSYFSRGEFDSFFDNSGMLYPPFSVYNVFNYMSWWL